MQDARPALVVEVVSRALFVAVADPEARDRTGHDPRGHVLGSDPEAGEDAWPERLEHHVGPAEERRAGTRASAGRSQDDRFLALVEGVVPAWGRIPHRVAARLLDPHDARAEPEQLCGRERPRQIAGQVHDEHPLERPLHRPEPTSTFSSALVERSAGAEEKRRLILDAAVRVFAHKGFHTSRVGDIAEEAGVAHGLLYHYFSSKDEVLDTIFRETWSDLLAEIYEIESSDASAREQLQRAAARCSWLADASRCDPCPRARDRA